jgi:hypothetical protein
MNAGKAEGARGRSAALPRPPPQRKTGTVRTPDWLIIGMLGVVFAPAVLAMSEVWNRLGYHAHGYLVPVVALWAATAKRGLLPTLPAARDRRGLLVLGLAAALDLVGTISRSS